MDLVSNFVFLVVFGIVGFVIILALMMGMGTVIENLPSSLGDNDTISSIETVNESISQLSSNGSEIEGNIESIQNEAL